MNTACRPRCSSGENSRFYTGWKKSFLFFKPLPQAFIYAKCGLRLKRLSTPGKYAVHTWHYLKKVLRPLKLFVLFCKLQPVYNHLQLTIRSSAVQQDRKVNTVIIGPLSARGRVRLFYYIMRMEAYSSLRGPSYGCALQGNPLKSPLSKIVYEKPNHLHFVILDAPLDSLYALISPLTEKQKQLDKHY